MIFSTYGVICVWCGLPRFKLLILKDTTFFLEPAGTIDVKFKKIAQLHHAHRLDSELQSLDHEKGALVEELSGKQKEKDGSGDRKQNEEIVAIKQKISETETKIKLREKKVLPYYQQVCDVYSFRDVYTVSRTKGAWKGWGGCVCLHGWCWLYFAHNIQHIQHLTATHTANNTQQHSQ